MTVIQSGRCAAARVRIYSKRLRGEATTTHAPHEELLRRLALNDEATVESVLGQTVALEHTNLGSKTCALARLAALVAIDASPSTYQWGIGAALAAGVDEHELVDLLLTVAPIVGAARTSAAAPAFAGALGYDLGEPAPN